MGYKVKIQKVQRPTNNTFTLNVPAAIAESLEMEKGEVYEWIIEDKNTLVLKRVVPLEINVRANIEHIHTDLWSLLLGNLSLLEGDINKDVGNFDYIAKRNGCYPKGYENKKGGVKRKSYLDSMLPSIKELLGEGFDIWDFDKIEARQKLLAQKALKIWSL